MDQKVINLCLPNGHRRPGIRFAPTTHELVMWYLTRKVLGETLYLEPVVEIDIYKFDPWELQQMACEFVREELVWYFFCPEKKHCRGNKNTRTTKSGYWKGTGEAKDIFYNDCLVAKRKTLVFHEGNSNKRKRTDWVMHEYNLVNPALGDNQDSFILCKIFQKPEQGPQNGAEYGAPFKMDMWMDIYRAKEVVPTLETAAPVVVANQNSSAAVNPNIAEISTGVVDSNGSSLSSGFAALIHEDNSSNTISDTNNYTSLPLSAPAVLPPHASTYEPPVLPAAVASDGINQAPPIPHFEEDVCSTDLEMLEFFNVDAFLNYMAIDKSDLNGDLFHQFGCPGGSNCRCAGLSLDELQK